MRIAGKTDIGRTRAENQDNFRSGSIAGVAGWGIVCDGMGGAQHGKLASTIGVETIEARFFEAMEAGVADSAIEQLMLDAVGLANGEIFVRSGSGRMVMGTTVVCAILRHGKLHVAHVGDSRAYLYENGRLRQITRDHSMVQELVDQGALTADQARRHPEKNVITRALGVERGVQAEYSVREVAPGAMVLLCTDGLTNLVGGERIAEMIETKDFYDLPYELVSEALQAGGSDNITVLLIQTQEGDEADG